MDSVSKKYLQKMLAGYKENIPHIDKHIEEMKEKLLEAQNHKLEMLTAIQDITEIVGVESDALETAV